MADLSRERHLMISQIAYASSPDVRFEEVKAILVEYDRRVTELLAANTAVVERRRAAEAECARLSALAADIGRERLVLAEKLRAADFAADTYCAERDATYEKLSAERRKREAAEALVERMWPIVEAVARAFEEKKVRYEKINSDWHLRMPDHWPADMSLTMQVIRAAGALVREREEKETT